jgi:hypothetical protein
MDTRAGDQVLGFALLPAERAGRLVLAGGAAADPSAGAARRLDDLVNSLVAEAERGRQFAQRAAVQMQAPYGPVELGPGHLGVTLSVDQPLLGLPGRGQQLIVHDVYRN